MTESYDDSDNKPDDQVLTKRKTESPDGQTLEGNKYIECYRFAEEHQDKPEYGSSCQEYRNDQIVPALHEPSDDCFL
jgi:hypothetical protein